MKSKKLLLINGISAIIGFYVIVYASSDKEGGKIFYLISRFVEVPDLRNMVYFTCFILLILAFLAFFLHDENSKVNKKTYQFLFTASILGFVPFFSYFFQYISFSFRSFVPDRLCEFIKERCVGVKLLSLQSF